MELLSGSVLGLGSGSLGWPRVWRLWPLPAINPAGVILKIVDEQTWLLFRVGRNNARRSSQPFFRVGEFRPKAVESGLDEAPAVTDEETTS
jgi:hypothetical protein